MCWRDPLTPALRGQKQGDLCEFKHSLIYKASSRLATEILSKKGGADIWKDELQIKSEASKREARIYFLAQEVNSPGHISALNF